MQQRELLVTACVDARVLAVGVCAAQTERELRCAAEVRVAELSSQLAAAAQSAAQTPKIAALEVSNKELRSVNAELLGHCDSLQVRWRRDAVTLKRTHLAAVVTGVAMGVCAARDDPLPRGWLLSDVAEEHQRSVPQAPQGARGGPGSRHSGQGRPQW